MAVATIMLVDSHHLCDFYFSKDPALLARNLLEDGLYDNAFTTEYDSSWSPRRIAEDLFDLTNNPSRDDERADKYGRGRSLSVGDVVNVDGANFLCASVGWIKF